MIASLLLAAITVATPLVFADLSPSAALQRAVTNSPEVAAAGAEVAQSEATLGIARNAINPALSTSYAQTPQGNPPGPNITARALTVGLSTTLNDFLNYGATVRQNILLVTASRADLATALRTERVRTIGLYYDALRARAIASAQSRALAIAMTQRNAASKRLAAGDAPQLDVLRADVSVARATAALATAQVADLNAREALRIETGVTDATLDATTAASAPTLPAPLAPTVPNAASIPESISITSTLAASGLAGSSALGLASAVSTALATRAEVASAGASLAAAQAGQSLAARSGFPAIAVTGGYTTGTDSDVPIGAPSINATLNVPLGAAAHDRVLIEEARVAQARAQVEVARRAVAIEVGAAARNVAALSRAAAASSRARQEAQAELTATELGYRNGASSSLEVSSARETYDQTVVDELGALYDLRKARATLAIEVGP